MRRVNDTDSIEVHFIMYQELYSHIYEGVLNTFAGVSGDRRDSELEVVISTRSRKRWSLETLDQ